MWYSWLEEQRALMQSLSDWAMPGCDAWLSPSMPCVPVAAAGYDWLCRLVRPTLEAPPFGIEAVTMGTRSVPVVEQVVDSTPFCALRQFARAHSPVAPRRGQKRAKPPDIFLCAPLAGHHAVMLRETVETLLQDGDVYVTDWANARDVPLAAGPFGLDDYVLAVERFLLKVGCAHTHVIALCQATAPTLAAASLLAREGEAPPLSLTLMGGPIDARLNPTAVDRLAQSHSLDWFRDTVIDTVPPGYAGSGRRVCPGFIQHAAIVAAQPHRQLALELRYWSSRLSVDAKAIAASLRALNEYAAVLDMAEDYMLDTIRVIFQEQQLARGTWRVGGRCIQPQDLAGTALCTVEGDRDDIAGAGQTHAAHTLCSAVPVSKRCRVTIPDCDHYDLFTGPRWREVIHPAVVRFWRSMR
ncbi:polyhydroxyalkanoate depolymerase [Paraburkholderia phytofirmans]|jgi:polyhydroxyalkanoate depolymerase|uniref:polyhydroxyalkanoate depolymerase n=1 Tax=Paraburkholderia sp. BL9I2N2 TaxID=1938809 RepID=UPI00104F26B6|nr:polyhydroxyalkanoate depolymerase [Paraburkholderia sp. BL9I2N2]TCK88783.1 polyhydroxyalkanoate depolymerase [Paraburkholderia sp. BL9I2N2]